jgi:hypothetical protein
MLKIVFLHGNTGEVYIVQTTGFVVKGTLGRFVDYAKPCTALSKLPELGLVRLEKQLLNLGCNIVNLTTLFTLMPLREKKIIDGLC